MKTIVIIPCKNQDEMTNICINKLKEQSIVPNEILVIDDRSSTIDIAEDNLISVYHTKDYKIKGRAATRNLGIKIAMSKRADKIIFMDGDTIPHNKHFIKSHLKYDNDSLVFGLRQHVFGMGYMKGKLYIEITSFPRKYPSDLLTSNMDNRVSHKSMDGTDLRKVSGMVKRFNKPKDFNQMVDYILTGWVCWSCNFSIGRDALDKIYQLNNSWFDEKDFNDGWGYEDLAFGLDAAFAGVDIKLSDKPVVDHLVHDRSDELYTHIDAKHKIMNRYRKLAFSKK